eukprot:124167_1
MSNFAIDKTRQDEKIALNSDVEMHSSMNKHIINHELNEGAGYDSRNDIIDTPNSIVKSTTITKTMVIVSLMLLLYCVIGITYLLFLKPNNICQCPQSIVTSAITKTNLNSTNSTIKTRVPTIAPSTAPSNNPSVVMDIKYKHYAGDYKISAQNASHASWLLCDGSFMDPNIYNKLFKVIGYSFGRKIFGSTVLFALPNAKDKSIGINGDAYKIGDKIGKANMSLNIENIPQHSHWIARNGQCSNAHGYSQDQPYLSKSCGLLKNSVYAYSLATTTSSPDSIPTSDVGSGHSFELYQPTIFMGNLFVYAGNN